MIGIGKYLWLGVIALIGMAFVWDHHRGVVDGKASRDRAAAAASLEQKKRDDEVTQATLTGMQACD